MRILKVADVAHTLTAGVSGSMLQNGEALSKLGHDVDYWFWPDLLGARWKVPVRRLAVPVVICLKIWRTSRHAEFDVVEIHEPRASLYAWLSSTRWGQRRLPPCVVLSHGLEERYWATLVEGKAAAGASTSAWARMRIQATLLAPARLALRRAAHAMVLNRADRDHVVRALAVPAERVTIVFNGVDPTFFAIQRRSATQPRLLFLGSWIERKGITELVQAWASIHDTHPELALTLAGTGTPAESVLEAFSETCRPGLTVLPEVPRDALAPLLAEHDVLLLPSWFEGMPMVALEAAAAGLAVVATRVAGTTEVFRPPQPERDGAVLVGPREPAEFASAVLRLADDPERLSELQSHARQRASGFTWSVSAETFETVYAKAMSRAHEPSGGTRSMTPRVNRLRLPRGDGSSKRTPLKYRPIGAMLFLRDPVGQHTLAEREALVRNARGRSRVVEIGVAEGVSAAALREAMDSTGTLWLVDPLSSRYPISPRQVVARRVVGAHGTASVRWLYKLSLDAAKDWAQPIDFLFIDADHAEEACEADWRSWSSHVVPAGRVAFHDSALSASSHARPDWGPVRVVDRHFRNLASRDPDWRIVEEVDSLTVVERI